MSLKARTSTVASSTTLPAGSSDDVTRTPNGVGPACTVGWRGGARMMLTVPDASGNNDSESGLKLTHGAAAPRASKV